MKRCPECRRNYYDDTLLYCLDDGNALLEGPGLSEPPASPGGDFGNESQTAILHETAPRNEAATRAQLHTTEQTAVLHAAEAEPHEGSGGLPERQSHSANRTAKPLIAAGLALLMILGGFFAYRYVTEAKNIESIAVMPFVNESGNADVEYLSDGMTETLISSLSQIPNLSVKARSSVFRYKGKEVEPKKVAAELGVQAILSGRVSQRGEQLTLGLELIDAQTENVIWSENYNRKQGDLTTLQSEIARDVSGKLRTKLSGADQNQIAKSYTTNADAYQLYLKGRFYWNKRTKDDIKKSIEYFDQAIALDKNYALAYAGLADAWQVLPSFTNDPPAEEAYPKARIAAQKALEIDPALAQPHAALGVVLHEYDWKFAEAESEFKKAIELDPNYASAHQWYGEYLKHMGRFDEAIAESKRAQELEPLSIIIHMMSGRAYYAAKQYDEAIVQYQKSLEIDPNFQGALVSLAEVYLFKGMFEEAINIDRKLDLAAGVPPEVVEKRVKALEDAHRRSGAKGYWETNLQIAKDVAQKHNVELPPGVLAFVHMNMGNGEEALSFLEQAFEKTRHDKFLIGLKANPVWEPIRGEPRFRALLRKIGLPE